MTKSAERLHVFRIYERLPPMTGGMERHIYELSEAQRKQGIRVTNIYNTGTPNGEAICLFNGYELHRLRPTFLRELIFYGAASMQHIKTSPDAIKVVHAHGGWSSFLFSRMLAKSIKAHAVAASLHAFMPPSQRLHQLAMSHCDLIFATGLNEVRYLEQATGKKVYHLPSAPSDIFFSKPDPTQRNEPTDVVVVANLFPVKNISLVLSCAKLRPKIRFSIYGDGPERRNLEENTISQGISNVKFYGSRPANEIHAALHSARLFLNVSFSEGSPTAALEAMACGLPVVLTPGNDYSSIVSHRVNGYLTTNWEVNEILNGIDTCIADEIHRLIMGKEARKTAEMHRWSAKSSFVTQKMLDVAD